MKVDIHLTTSTNLFGIKQLIKSSPKFENLFIAMQATNIAPLTLVKMDRLTAALINYIEHGIV